MGIKSDRTPYCFLNGYAPYPILIRPATPRAKLRFRTAHPGGFLFFADMSKVYPLRGFPA